MTTAAERLAASLDDRYRIERELGQGGMSTVYLAEDTRHHRKVAIKVLHPDLSAVLGSERFLKEIELTANLQHPHILPLFDSGSADGLLYYVMPYIEGETLRGKLDRERQLPIEDSLRIASDVADALEYAHRRHVIHRDIKPENILLVDGRPVVADFGIALAVEHAGGARMTQTGISLGTPQYMAPEQAMGDKSVDHRADIYALGAVVYEMLAGEPPFSGPNTQAIVARVITEKPRSLTAIRSTVTPQIDEAVYAALQKLPADRPLSAREFARLLTEKRSPFEFEPAQRMTSSSLTAGVIGTAILFGIAGYALGYQTHDDDGSGTPSRLAMMTPSVGGEGLATLHRQIAITPDGSALVYVAQGSGGENALFYQRLDSETPSLIRGATRILDPRISQDGRTIYGLSAPATGAAFRNVAIPVAGGEPVTSSGDAKEPATDREGTRWFLTRDSERPVYRFQQQLPGGKSALVIQAPHGTNGGPVFLADIASRTVLPLISETVVEIRYGAGIVAFVKQDGTLSAARFDVRKGELKDAPVQVATGVALTGSGLAQFAFSESGNLAYIPEEPRWLALVDRRGRMRYATSERRSFHSPRFSPDGKRISVDFSTESGRDVWILSLGDSTLSRATFARDGHDATWMPGGKYITYSSVANGQINVYRTTPGGSTHPDSLPPVPNLGYTGEWLSDGSGAITTISGTGAGANYDIGLISSGGNRPVRLLIADQFNTAYPAVSPDGKWLAFVSDRSGAQEVYVRPINGDADDVQVSSGGASEPVWSRDGQELFYRAMSSRGTDLVAAAVRTSPSFGVISRTALFPVSEMSPAVPHANYDISPDGQTFALVRRSQSSRVVVIQNLPEMLNAMRSVKSGQR
ncbi:MAG TPA: protein kinase [Gemmatimonadaceae bacterium]